MIIGYFLIPSFDIIDFEPQRYGMPVCHQASHQAGAHDLDSSGKIAHSVLCAREI